MPGLVPESCCEVTGGDMVAGRAQCVFASGVVLPTGPTAHGRTGDRVFAPSEEPAPSPSSPWNHLVMERADLSLAYVEALVGKTQRKGPEL